MLPSLKSEIVVPLFVDKRLWKLVSVDSEHGGDKATNAFDDNINTIWHTLYSGNVPTCPHEIVVDMGKTYRVTEFLYQGRSDGSNGRIRNYSLYFSNSTNRWGAPAAEGSLENTSDEQAIVLTTPVEARYFRLIARSEVGGNAWTSAAELGVVATAIVDERSEKPSQIQSGTTYYLREKSSCLYLHYKAADNGDFCLARKSSTDQSFRFKVTRLARFTSFYTMGVASGVIGKGNANWRAMLITDASKPEGWMQLEEGDDHVRLRGAWMGNQYFNFDSRSAGSIVFTDKATPAQFVLEDVTTDGIANFNMPEREEDEGWYTPSGLRVDAPAKPGLYIHHHTKVVKH
jgi:beta-galactosidase